jgi:hypothetical protein
VNIISKRAELRPHLGGARYAPEKFTLHALNGEIRCVIDVDPKDALWRATAEREARRIIRDNLILFPVID